MLRLEIYVFAFAVLLPILVTPALADDPTLGFFADAAEKHHRAEATALAVPTPDNARRWLAALTEEPHVAGTPEEKAVAEYVHARLEDFGLEAETVRYEAFLNHPRHVALRLVAPEEIELSLVEGPIPGDKDSAPSNMFPGFHGYGASGTAKGQVVYVNYGTAADFAKLEEMGVSVAGRIVLARYGQVFRGLKIKEAEEHGAVGVILYSDPADDGYMRGDVYPDGPMRPPTSLQRGSVQYLSWQPGDPSTPGGRPSLEGAERLARSEMKNVPGIPSLPISYGEAEKILRHLAGPNVPGGWQGGLPFAYHLGPGSAVVEMEVEMDEGLMPIYNVFGRIRGSEEPERVIVLGNHRDAWTHGAVDPNSGTTAWLEAARALGAAAQAGWTPRRTVVFASWDAEEYGLVGSVEWGEHHAERLHEHGVAYINLDAAVLGRQLGLGGVPSLAALAREVAARVDDPLAGGKVGDAWEHRAHAQWAQSSPIDLDAPGAETFTPRLGALGSGSDYTVFLDHLGIPALDFGFSGHYGVYHSAYDNFDWMNRFGDPRLVMHRAAAQMELLFAMRLASADVLPLRFGDYGPALGEHLDALRRRVVRQARASREGVSANTRAPSLADFEPVLDALERFSDAGTAADAAVDALVERQDTASAARVNPLLMEVERRFLAGDGLTDDGLPGRPWFRHLIWAPGTTTGYAPWPFPELAEAVETGDRELFQRGAARVTAALDRAVETLKRVVAEADPAV